MYLDPERRLMGAISQQAEQFYRESGLQFAPGLREVSDHVAIELEFMYYLAFQEATFGEPVWLARQRRFWGHLGCWLPDFVDAIATANCHRFYFSLADLLDEFCKQQTRFWNRR